MNLDHNFGLLILVCGFLLSGIHGRTDDSLRITLSHGGKIVGRYVTTHDGKGVRAFLGVPYAEPPVGPLRFKVEINLGFLTFEIFFFFFFFVQFVCFVAILFWFN